MSAQIHTEAQRWRELESHKPLCSDSETQEEEAGVGCIHSPRPHPHWGNLVFKIQVSFMEFKGSPGKLASIPPAPQQLCVQLSIPPVNAIVGVIVMSPEGPVQCPLPGRD